VLTDVAEIRCPHPNFASTHLKVAPSLAGPVVVGLVSDYYESRLFSVGPDAELLMPAGFGFEEARVIFDGAGVLHVMGGLWTPDGLGLADPPIHATLDPGGGWTEETLEPMMGNATLSTDLEVDPAGRLNLWRGQESGWFRTVRQPGGSWTKELAFPVGDYFNHFTLTQEGQPVAFVVDAQGVPRQVKTRYQGAIQLLGPPPLFFDEYKQAVSPTGPFAGGPAFVAVVHAIEGLTVSPGPEGSEVAIPATLTQLPCMVKIGNYGADEPCPDTCHDTGEGLELGAFAAARGPDGATYVAHVISHVDRQVGYDRSCSILGCSCSAVALSDQSTGELHLTAVSPAGQLIGTSILAIPGPLSQSSGASMDARAAGNRLAVALRVSTADGPAVSLSLDTARIGAP
jgi:hypothetical protein